MTYRLSAPFYFAIPIALTSIPLTMFLPGGSRTASPNKIKDPLVADGERHSTESASPGEQERLLVPDHEGFEDSASIEAYSQSTNAPVSKGTLVYLRSLFKASQKHLQKFGEIFARYQIVKFAWVAQLVSKLGKQVFHILPQYLSKRFGISIAEVSRCYPSTHLRIITDHL
jgi:hypothetical protein